MTEARLGMILILAYFILTCIITASLFLLLLPNTLLRSLLELGSRGVFSCS